MDTKFFLPGTEKQSEFLHEYVDVNGYSILIIGTGCEQIARNLFEKGASKVIIIVEDNDSLLNSRFQLQNSDVNVRLMEFDNTDFKDSSFDLVYAQASVSNKKRNKITKEVLRILKPCGYYCVGEITSPSKSAPQFITDLWQSASITPLHPKELEQFYTGKKFEAVWARELSHTLRDFYTFSIDLLKDNVNSLSEQEKSYYKKLLNRISHESNAYLKLGGDAHIGFYAFILRKADF